MTVTIRKIAAHDERRWRELWDAYTRFYEREPSEPITRHAWARILDERSPVHAIVAERDAGVIGIANYIIHESTSLPTPVCYLQDLFVDPSARAGGVGRALIDWLIEEARGQRWSRVYWTTKENNYRARGLYDSYAPRSDFVQYRIDML